MTAKVLLTGTNGITTTARAFLDNGAGLSIVSCSMRNTLALRSTGTTVKIDGVGGISVPEACPLVRVTLSTNYKKGWKKDLTVAVVPKPAMDIPLKNASETKDLTHLQGLVLADSHYDKPGPIDIMLGQDVWDQLFLKGEIMGPEGTPSARQTVFGWVVSGLYQSDGKNKAVPACSYYVSTTQANKVSDDLLSQFFKIEEPPSPKKEFTAEEKRVEKEYEETHEFNKEEKRYMVTLPRTPSQLQLGESRKQALNRAASNERSLIRRQKYNDFQSVMLEYIDLGHARPVSPQDMLLAPPSIYYMPVHSVIKESSTSTKIRAVFDASATTSTKVSLNDLLAIGPTIQPALDQTLLKFRMYPVAISGDISKMYREILLSPEDRSLHRFLWRKNPSDEWTDYEMLRVTFGVTASPYVAIKTLQQAANDFGKGHPEAQSHIKESFYVDDFFAGASTPQEAIKLRQEISDILSEAGFTIKKWRSSSPRVLKSVPVELQEPIPSQELVDSHSAHYPKALGLIWDSRKDKMAAKIEVAPTYSSTKRGVASDVAKTFDVLGWLSPVTLNMKLLYRKLWQLGLDWDQEVPNEVKIDHEEWRNNLYLLAEIRLPRYYFTGSHPENVTLQGFSDASKDAFAAVVYIRATYASGPPSITLVISKTKVAPLEGRSIPELELCGAHLLAKILVSTAETLQLSVEGVRAYSDSTIILAWLDGSPKRERIYVANRICKINKLIPTTAWSYVSSGENPADCASRGITANELINHPLWWEGPPWLKTQPLTPPPVTPAEVRSQKEKYPCEAKPVHVCRTDVTPSDWQLEEASNSYATLVKITCWFLRFIARAKKKEVPSELRLSVSEYAAAEDFLIKRSQSRTYSAEISLLSSEPPKLLSKRCHLVSLQPKLNEKGILCVGGRLGHALIPEREKHPVILSAKDTLTKKLFQKYHLDLNHGGPTAILSLSGALFYVSGARRLARSTCSKCTICRRASATAGSQLMGQLPPSRLDPDYVFFNTGIDYAGPYKTLAGHTRRPVELKTYLAVFICFYTKAVHLELVRDATTESFIAALTRFCGRRGLPKVIHSDHGSNFMGAKNQLEELYQLLENDETKNEIQSYLLQQKITWETVPVRAPHFGGLWEAAVRSTKFHLKRVIGERRLKYDELETVIIQVEACLNSRPLGAMASHPLDGVCPLTPGHFLIGRALKSYPEEAINFNPTPLQRWVHCQKIIQGFWKRWSQEYLQQLQRAVKWHKREKNFQPGDIVLLTDGNTFHQQWSTARIEKVYTGVDGAVRAADVRVVKSYTPEKYDNKRKLAEQIVVKTAVYRRPIHKLAMLLAMDEVPEDCQLDVTNLPSRRE